MKQILFLFCISLLAHGSVFAQQGRGVKAVEPDITDIIRTLEVAGYQFYSFDISSLKDKTYKIEVFLKETDSTGTKEKFRVSFGNSRKFLKDVSEEYRADFTPIDKKTGLYQETVKVGVSVVPTTADSIQRMNISLGKNGGFTQRLNLHPLERDSNNYLYQSRPFKLTEFQSGEDIPLVLYGSFWYDEKAKVHRFCGEREIAPDLSTEMVKDIPHYYTVGIRLTESK